MASWELPYKWRFRDGCGKLDVESHGEAPVAFPHLCTVNAYRRVTIETGETKWTFIHQTWTWGFNMVSEY